MPTYDSPDWDWGRGCCARHPGQELPCKACIDSGDPDLIIGDGCAFATLGREGDPLPDLSEMPRARCALPSVGQFVPPVITVEEIELTDDFPEPVPKPAQPAFARIGRMTFLAVETEQWESYRRLVRVIRERLAMHQEERLAITESFPKQLTFAESATLAMRRSEVCSRIAELEAVLKLAGMGDA